MKKFILSAIVILGLGGYFIFSQNNSSIVLNNDTASVPTTNIPKPQPVATPVQTHKTTPVSAPPIKKPLGMYKDGSYVGSAEDAYYGTVQVKAVVSGGKLTDVAYLSIPDSSGHTRQVSAYATPILRSEAIQAQSANVDTVSGATATSDAFVQSLTTALAIAKN